MTIAPRYAIGDPGRAALEVGEGVAAGVEAWPDTDVQRVQQFGLEIRGASSRGLAHRWLGQPRQDAFGLSRVDDALVVVVCDGLGSFDRSHEAAALIARDLPDLIASAGRGAAAWPWQQVFAAVSARLDACMAAASSGGETAHMATTVVAAAVTPAETGWAVELGWVGDSAAFLLREGSWTLLTTAADGDRDQPFSTATAALPCADIVVDTVSARLLPGDAVFLMTDGVALPLGAGTGEVGAALAKWWASPPEGEEFLAQVGFARRSFDDDRTVVGIWCPSAGDAS